MSDDNPRRWRQRLLLTGGLLLTGFGSVVIVGNLAYLRTQNCFYWASEGRTAAINSPQGWLCGEDEGVMPDAIIAMVALGLTFAAAALWWRKSGVRGWCAGLVLLLVMPLLVHLALIAPPDVCSDERIRERGTAGCSTDRELGPDG